MMLYGLFILENYRETMDSSASGTVVKKVERERESTMRDESKVLVLITNNREMRRAIS